MTRLEQIEAAVLECLRLVREEIALERGTAADTADASDHDIRELAAKRAAELRRRRGGR